MLGGKNPTDIFYFLLLLLVLQIPTLDISQTSHIISLPLPLQQWPSAGGYGDSGFSAGGYGDSGPLLVVMVTVAPVYRAKGPGAIKK